MISDRQCLGRSRIGELLASAASRLGAAGIEGARHEALLLLAHVTGATTAELLAHPERDVAEVDRERFGALVRRRAAREPLAYVVGYREFYGLRIAVDRRVLVPRPETEVLVEEALRVLGGMRQRGILTPSVVDVGTGSGAIACAVAVQVGDARIVGVDCSAEALRVADANRCALGLAGRVRLVRGDLLEWLRGPVDLVVTNLPYLQSALIPTLMPEVAGFEPRMALDGGPDGTKLMRRMLVQVPRLVRPGGIVLVELDPDQVDPLRELAPGICHVIRDLAGHARVLRIDLE